jgi:hypothetical protein
MAADMWVLKADLKKSKKYAAGFPKRGWVGRWVKCYDPRKDSTYPGGSGAHRIDNEATWEYTENPWLHELTWEIGRRCANGLGQIGAAFTGSLLFLGVGMPAQAIDLPSYVYAANIADVNGWKVSGVVYSNEEKWAVAKTIALAGGGEPIKLGSKVSAFVNAPKVSAETITQDDLIGPVSVPTSPPFQSRINRIIPKYLSEAHGWEMVDAAPLGVDAWRIQDRGQWRTEGQPYRLVPSVTQAAQLTLYQIADSRERNGIVLALKPQWKGYGPGSCLTLNLPAFGLINKKVVVIDRQEDAADRMVILTFRTEDDNKHPLALAGTGTPPPGVNLVPADLSNVSAPTSGSWAAVGGQIVNAGAQIPVIVITGSVDNPNADQVIFEYRPAGSTDADWRNGGTDDAATKRKEITSVASSASYDVAVSYVVRGVISARRVLGPVTVGEQRISTSLVDGLSSLVAAKSSVFYGVTFPAITASQEHDTFIHLGQGKKAYRRVAGDGLIAIGGSEITIAGETIGLCWTPADDDRIGQAVLDAAGAAALADSKVEAFITTNATDPVPIASGPGDIWIKRHLTPVEVWVANASLVWQAASTYGATAAQISDIASAQSAASAAQADATAGLAQIGNIINDGVLDKSEKPDLVLRYNALISEQAGIQGNAVYYGITTERTAYDAAITALTSYLTGLSPAYNDYAADTVITRITFNTTWKNAFDARQALLNKIAEEASRNVPLMTVGNGPVILCDYQGTPKGGQLPRVIGNTRKRGNITVDASTSWTATFPATLTGSIDNLATDGLRGDITLTAATGEGEITVTSVYDGVTLTDKIKVTRTLDPPPPPPPSSGASQATSSVAQATQLTTYPSSGLLLGPVAAGSSGQIRLEAYLEFWRRNNGNNGAYGKWGYSTSSSGPFTDIVAGEVSSTGNASKQYFAGEFYDEPGVLSINQVLSGLTNGTDYYFEFRVRKNGTNSTQYVDFYGDKIVTRI